jgi:7-carboxy-7-deazaguanine synthase
MLVNEIFKSVSGEVSSMPQGQMCTFVRFQGCNLACRWCDTKKALQPISSSANEMAVSDIIDIVDGMGCKNILFTGGEPLCQDYTELLALCISLKNKGYLLHIETNGTLRIPSYLSIYFDSIVIDYKLPGSGCYANMPPLSTWIERHMSDHYFIKLIIDTLEDIDVALHIVSSFVVNRSCHNNAQIAIGTTGNQIDYSKLLSVFFEYDCIINVQLHKLLNLP